MTSYVMKKPRFSQTRSRMRPLVGAQTRLVTILENHGHVQQDINCTPVFGPF